MEKEPEKSTALTFGVGLNKTEYVLFQKEVAKFTAGKRFFRFAATVVAVCAGITLINLLKSDPADITDPYVLSSLLFFVLLFLALTVFP